MNERERRGREKIEGRRNDRRKGKGEEGKIKKWRKEEREGGRK